MSNLLEQLNNALQVSLNTLVGDGKPHRFSTNGKPSDKSGWYVMPSDNVVIAGDWRTGRTVTLFDDGVNRDDPEAQAAIMRARIAYRAERQRVAAEAAQKAGAMLDKSKPLDRSHAYVVRKMITSMPLVRSRLRAKTIGDNIVVDLCNVDGEIVGLQFIAPDGGKKFLTGTAKQGAWHWLMHDRSLFGYTKQGQEVQRKRINDQPIAVVEGWATGCAVAQMHGLDNVVVAFDAGNLKHVVSTLLQLYPFSKIVIFADDDDPSTGKAAGKAGAEAAKALNPDMVGIHYPAWAGGVKPAGASDFADLYCEVSK